MLNATLNNISVIRGSQFFGKHQIYQYQARKDNELDHINKITCLYWSLTLYYYSRDCLVFYLGYPGFNISLFFY